MGCLLMRIVLAMFMLIMGSDVGAAMAATWPTSPATCRDITDALLHGKLQAATDLFTPPDGADHIRKDVRSLMRRLAESIAAGTDHLLPRLERVLPDITVDHLPASLELWSFGDSQAYLVGCAIRPAGESARISLQAYPRVSDIIAHLHAALFDADPSDGDDAPAD